MTLTEFLLARIAEDERVARYVLSDYAAHRPNWDCPVTAVVNLGDPGIEGLLPTGDGPLAYHIAQWDPARVLAECEAKRRLAESFTEPSRPHRVPMPWPDGEVIAWKCRACDQWCNDGASDGDCPVDWREPPSVLRLLALPYADHPDYREEWRP